MSIFALAASYFFVGLFAIGGGLAAIPIMQQLIVGKGWIAQDMFFNIVAISESTPGPIGINMATYIGFEKFGILGALTTTVSIVLPSFIIILLIARSYSSFLDNRLIKDGLYGIRATVTGLIASAAFSVLCATVFTPDRFAETHSLLHIIDLKNLIIFAVIFALYKIFNKHPIFYIIFGALCGIVFL